MQAYTAETDLLRSALNVFISPNEHPDQDWDMEFFKSCLRSLMLKNRSSRSNAAEKLSKMLEEKENLPHVTGKNIVIIAPLTASKVAMQHVIRFKWSVRFVTFNFSCVRSDRFANGRHSTIACAAR